MNGKKTYAERIKEYEEKRKEGTRYFTGLKVKTPEYQKGITESGGVRWENEEDDALYHSDREALEEWVYKNLTDHSDLEKHQFMIRVQHDPNWEDVDLKVAWHRERKIDREHDLQDPIYEGEYPGDEVYRNSKIMRRERKRTTDDKIFEFLPRDEGLFLE
tara:strand:+ start:59 stop:538 length:480 start_codon:yes stop_codon:yes gene_type:complete